MAYDGGYRGGQQRPYAGPAAQPPVPRGYGGGPPSQHGQAHDGYGAGGFAQDYGHGRPPPQARGGRPPPHGVRGGGPMGRPPMPDGRGGPPPMGRPPTADGYRGRGGHYPPRGGMGPAPGRGMPPGPGRGGGRPGPGPHQYPPKLDTAGGRPPTSNGPVTPQESFGPSAYQSYSGQQLVNQMSAMDLNSSATRGPSGGSRASSEMHSGRAPPSQGSPSYGYPDPRRGPPGQAAGGYGEYDGGYSPQAYHPRNEFTSPRSMTMPYNSGPAGQGMPPRPATTTGNRPAPHRIYPPGVHSPPQDQYYNDDHGYEQSPINPIDDVYASYYDDEPSASGSDFGGNMRRASRSSMPDFDAIPMDNKRSSFEQSMQTGIEQSHAGAHQAPTLNHAQSMVDMREPLAAVFEMTGDIPEVPAMPYQLGYDQGYNGPGGYDQAPPPRGPSAPPGPAGQPGFANNPPINRPGTAAPTNPDGLPAHPTPVRPRLMQNSIVNPSGKPPPVRNYGATQQFQAPHPQQQQQQQQQHQQPYPQSQNQVAPGPGQQKEEEQPVTPAELEHLRMLTKNNPNDQATAFALAKRLLDASDVLVANLPDRAKARARERYLMDASKLLKKLCGSQNQEAMFLMADSLGRGLFSNNNEPDHKEAFTLYQSAAKLGHAAAAYRTAVCCEIGHEEGGGTRKDPLKAIQWYKRAATLGDPPAMYKVGMILLKGLLGQPKNPREAVGWLKRAAERADAENPHALHELGLLYESAQGNDVIIRDEPYALTLFQQAAELGYKFSQFKLGCAYEYGLLGYPIDPRLSIVWYSRAAQLEEHQSELALSGWYLTGSEGVLGQSDTEAYLWARKAAVAGLSKAEYAMGYFTEVGIGVPANLEDAKRWYWRAAAQDFPKARDRLEDLKRSGKAGRPRQRERISRSQQQDGDCILM